LIDQLFLLGFRALGRLQRTGREHEAKEGEDEVFHGAFLRKKAECGEVIILLLFPRRAGMPRAKPVGEPGA